MSIDLRAHTLSLAPRRGSRLVATRVSLGLAILGLPYTPSPALAGGPAVIESISPPRPYPGQSVYVDGTGFGEDAALGAVSIDGDILEGAVTFWSDELVIFTLPFLGGQPAVLVEIWPESGLPAGVPLLLDYPTDVFFVNLMPGHVASGPELSVRGVPEFDGGQVDLVRFSYRAVGELIWNEFAVDLDGRGEGAGTTTWIGEGDGWSGVLSLIDLPEGVYELEAEATDVHGQLMRGEFSFLYDPTPLAPHLLTEASERGATLQDDDALEVVVELTEAEAESLLFVLYPIDWHAQRELKKVDQDTLKIIDKDGNDVSDQACGPTAAASCLTWFGDRFPDLDKDPADLARKIAKAAGTNTEGTDSDSLLAAIKKVLEDCGQDPDDWGVSIEFGPKKVHRDMVQGLNKEGTDKIPLIYQKSTDDVNGDGVVDDDDVTGHYVTLSSRGSRYRDVMIPPTTHIIVVEKYVDFFNPATGETEEYQIDDSKEPPELIGYSMNGSSTGSAWIEAVICVRPPQQAPDRPAGGLACGFGHPLDEPVFDVVPVPGPGPVAWSVPAADLSAEPGPALLGVFARDTDGCVSGELYTEIVVGGFAQVAFTANVVGGDPPLAVEFTNDTAPTDSVISWEWDFDGDGVTDSGDENPTFVYETPGLYSVSLRAHNPHGSDHRVYEDLIAVSDVVGTGETIPAPVVTRLLPPSPNPFRTGTSLRFELSTPGDVRLSVHDVQGRAIWSDGLAALGAGSHAVSWDGRDRRGWLVQSGVYFVRFQTPGGVEQWASVRVVR